jgi:hypothetical protein
MRSPFLLLLCSVVPAQDPTTPQDLRRLAETVDAVHRPTGRQPITGFRAALAIEQTAADAEARGRIELEVRFLLWQKPGSQKLRPLIRYKLVDASKPTEQGQDQEGPWALEGGKQVDLDAAEREVDRNEIQRRTNLARQLLRFLDPGEVLRALKEPTPIADEPLKIGRTEPVPCTVVEGRLDAFPLLQKQGDDAPVRLKVFVHRENHRVVALQAWPLDKAGNKEATGEFMLFADHRVEGGVLLPMRLAHSLVQPDGIRRKQMDVTITSIALAPDLHAEDFVRPAK